VKIFGHLLSFAGGAVLTGLILHRWPVSPGGEAAPPAVGAPPPAVSARPTDDPTRTETGRLRLQNDELTAQLAEERARLAERDVVLARTKERLDELRRPMSADMLSSALRAEMKSGEVVVTGGYRLPDGRRLYAFARPTVEQAGGVEQVRIAVQILKITDETGASVGLDNIATNAANTLQHGEVWVADEFANVAGRLSADAGTAGAVFSPEVVVKPGDSGVIEAENVKLKITPAFGADHESLDFEVRLEQTPTPPVAPSQPPR
jgi:hypothetical protein